MTFVLSFTETLFMFFIYNTIFNLSFKRNIIKFISLSFLSALQYYIFGSILGIDKTLAFSLLLSIDAIIASKIDDKDTMIVLGEMGISTIILFIFELIIMLPGELIFSSEEVNLILYLIFIVISMSSFLFVLKVIIKRFSIDFRNFVSKYSHVNIIVINILIFFLFIKTLAVFNVLISKMIIQILVLSLLLVTINIFFLVYSNKKKIINKKIEINTNLNPLIDDLMIKMKANEHEYNNHLNVIYAMIQVCKEDELKSRAKTYIGNITSKNDVFNQISDVENTIVKAILYNKIPEAHKHNILMEYEIENDLNGIPLDDSELTVVLSNLINNAIESTKELECKEIDIYIGKINDRYVFEISNTIDENKNIDIKKILKYGVSSKGNGRGYGLYNVKSIIDKYKGKINIDIIDDRIQFIVEI